MKNMSQIRYIYIYCRSNILVIYIDCINKIAKDINVYIYIYILGRVGHEKERLLVVATSWDAGKLRLLQAIASRLDAIPIFHMAFQDIKKHIAKNMTWAMGSNWLKVSRHSLQWAHSRIRSDETAIVRSAFNYELFVTRSC